MRKLWLGLLLVFLGIAPAQAQGIGGQPLLCNQWAQASVAAGTSQMIAGVSGKVISICGFVFSSTGTATGQLVTGTGVNCATNQVALSAVWNVSANAPTGMTGGTATASVPQGNAICATIGTTTTNVQIIYTIN